MSLVRKLALFGSSAVALFSAGRGLQAHASVAPGRVYTSARNEWEFNQLLALPNPLLVNFCMLTDPKSKNVSQALQAVVKSGDAFMPVSSIDVEVDEPGVKDLMQRYVVAKIPTIVALHGGEPVQYLEPKENEIEELKKEVLTWVNKMEKK